LHKKFLMSAAMLAILIGVAPAAWAASADSQTFIKKAIEGNFAEVSLGQLAQQKSGSDGVKQLGQQLVTDHSQANEKAVQAANSIGVTPPTQPSKDQQDTQQKLSGEAPADFDRDFVRLMVDDHQKDIADYQKEARDNADDPAGQYATQTLPTLQKHLSMAQALAGGATMPSAPAKSPAASGPPYPGANSFTEGQTRSRLEAAGFTNVAGLHKDDQGIWRGMATKDGKQVNVALDYKGNVVSQ
jgi:putative membrane protein